MTLRENTKEISKVVLLSIAISGVVILTATSPGLGHLLKLIQKNRPKSYKPYRINQTLKRLQSQQLISIKEENNQTRIELLEEGRKKVLKYNLEEMTLKKGKWDKVWRVVIFDIPHDKKSARDFLRSKMKQLGFYQLQKSVLVTPWPCQNEMDFIKHFYDIGEYINFIEAKSIDCESKIKKHFHI